MFKKIGQYFKGMVSTSIDEDEIDGNHLCEAEMEKQEAMLSLRQLLVSAIASNNDSSDIVKSIIETETENFASKYALLDTKLLIDLNNQSVENLQNIVTGISLIIKYAQNLMKKKDQYKSIPLSNQHVQSKILPLNGSKYIMSQIGYSEQTNSTISFPPNTEPDVNIIVNLLADMLLFKAEMKYFLLGSHINPQQITALLPPSTIAQFNNRDQDVGQELLNASMQSIALENPGPTDRDQNNSNDTSPFYSAQSGTSNKESSEVSPREEALPEVEGEDVTPEMTSPPQPRPDEVTNMQDFDVAAGGKSETSSLRTPSSGFKYPCSLCNEEAQTVCKSCMHKALCENCDADWHSHPSRRGHITEKISEMDPTTAIPTQDNIVGPYGIIAQENPAAWISKKIQASSSDKSRRSPAVHDGEMGDNQPGNMPDFGSIMSGNLVTGAEDRNTNSPSHHQQQQQSPKLLARGGRDDKKVYKDQDLSPPARGIGPPTMQWQQQQQPHQHIGQLSDPQPSRHQIPLSQPKVPQYLQGSGNITSTIGFENTQQQPGHHQQQLRQLFNNPMSPPSHPQRSPPSHPQRSPPMQYMQPGIHPHSLGQFQGQNPTLPPRSTAQGQSMYSPQPVNYMIQSKAQSVPTFLGHPLQIPPVSQNFQYSQGNSPNELYYSPPQNQTRQQPFFPPQNFQNVPTSMYAGMGDYNVLGQQQQKPYAPPQHPHQNFYLGYYGGDKGTTPVSYPASYNTNPVYTSFHGNVTSQNQPLGLHAPMSQIYVQKQPDNEETSVQYTTRPHSMVGQQAYPTVSSSHQSQMPPKHSQTFPQLAPIPQAQPPEVNRILKPSHSTPDLEPRNPAHNILQQIDSELAVQKSKYSSQIDKLNQSLKHIDVEINDLLLEDEEVKATQRMKVKKELLKKKKELEKILKAMDSCNDESLEVHYPPATASDKGQHETAVVTTGIRRSPSKQPPEPHIDTSSSVQLMPAAIPEENDDSVPIIHPQSLPSPAFSSNESITDNTNSQNQLSAISQINPLELDLMADNCTTAKSDNSNPSSTMKWSCKQCTFMNEVSASVCVMCDAQRIDKDQASDFVCEKRKVSEHILYLQKIEEEMMEEKRKAKEKDTRKHPPSHPDKKQSFEGSITDRDKTDPSPGASTGLCELTGKLDTVTTVGSLTNQMASMSHAPPSALDILREAAAVDNLKKDGQVLVRHIKEADVAGYPVDAVPIALSFYNPQTTSVTEWLAKHWEKNMQKIVKEVDEIAAAREQNNIGRISLVEAAAACIECKGNLKNAVDVCIDKREELFKHLNALDSNPREEILQIMFTQQGDRKRAEEELIRHKLEGFVERIWKQGPSLNSILYPAGEALGRSANSDKCDSISTSALEQDAFKQLVKDHTVDRDRRIRMMMVESKLKSWGRGELVIDIMDGEDLGEEVSIEDIVEAVRNCRDRSNAIAFLKQPCSICYDTFPMSKIRNLSICKCLLCTDCMKGHFTVVITEKHVRHWTCPVCSLPNMNEEETCTDYLTILQPQLVPIVSPELMTLFEDKVRDFSLQKDPLFRWCAHCGNGFLAVGNGAMTCNMCGKKTCFTCKRMWEDQHDGLTCEEFEQWKIDNDPNNQAVGLARHLEENGIVCVECNMRYSLAKGGCMHFKCPQCGHEFCSGCYEGFHQRGVCKKYKSCATQGFHCHHPRDCFSYLRDRKVEELQHLLQTNQVAFNTQVPEDQEDKRHCPVIEQKEEGIIKKDEMCGKEVEFQMAGLCPSHYKEYLTSLINKHVLDPVHLMNVQEMGNLLRRYDMAVPTRQPTEAEEAFKAKLLQIIQQKLPLTRKKLDRR